MFRILVLLFLPCAMHAATPAELARLHEAIGTGELIDILSEEGLTQADELQGDMFPGRGGVGWTATVQRIYSPERLNDLFTEAFDAELTNEDVLGLIEFYEGDVGARIAEIEVAARRAIMSDEVETAAVLAFEDLAESENNRVALMREFASANGLVDRNVAGALNSNLAFYRGLIAGGGFELTESEILRDVWDQEAEIRADTTEWVFGFMTLAYDTLSETDLGAYVDMTKTDHGQDLNRAFFAGFDAVFLDVSYALGVAASQFSAGDEL